MLQLPEIEPPKGNRCTTHRGARATLQQANLIAAANAFEPLLKEYLAIRTKWSRLARATSSKAEAAFAGQTWDGPCGKDPKFQYQRKLGQRNGYDAVCREMSKLHTKMQKFAKIIWATPPITIEGLRAHAMVAIWECQPLCADETELHFGDEVAHEYLFKAVVALTKLEVITACEGATA